MADQITPLPTPPSTTDPANFDARADAFLAALPDFATELNEFGAQLNNLSTSSVSASSLTIETGEQSLTVEAGKSYRVGMTVKVAYTTDPTKWMQGAVTSYESATGALMVNIDLVNGAGTFAAWTVTLGVAASIENGLATVASAATTDIWTDTANNIINLTGTETITGFEDAPQAGARRTLVAAAASSITAGSNLLVAGLSPGEAYTCTANDELDVMALTTTQFLVVIRKYSGRAVVDDYVPVRQTVLSGPVDTSGFSSFGGSTGSSTVTASGTLVATAANGTVNRTGSIANPSWTGLSTNGTMYLYLDIAADGSCTPGAGTLAPTYRWGGADVTTNGQFTFNIQEMVGKVGDGSIATQSYRVYVGEVTVASSVVSAIIWYALMGRYEVSSVSLPAAGTATSRSHNIGVAPRITKVAIVNGTTEANYSVNDEVIGYYENNSGSFMPSSCSSTRLTIATVRGSTGTLVTNKTTGVSTTITASNWTYKFIADRGW